MSIERAALFVAEIEKAAAGGPARPKGWASSYDNVDRMGRVMRKGAFGSTLAGKAHGGQDFESFKVPLLAYHDDTRPVGSSLMEPKATYGMRHDSTLAATDLGRDMAALVDAGAIPATSIGWDSGSAIWTVNKDGYRDYSFIDVLENSLCPCPANALAVLDAASLASSGAAPAWEKEVPPWVKVMWPDFARLQFTPPEVIRLSRAAADAGMEHTHAKTGGGKQTHTHEDAMPGHAHEGMLPMPKPKADVRSTAAGARHSAEDMKAIQAAHDATVMAGAECDQGDASLEAEVAAVWSADYKNALPDSAFAVVVGGDRDGAGLTVPRKLRKLAYRDADGHIDRAHLRAALSRVATLNGLDATQRRQARATLVRAAAESGVDPVETVELLHRGSAAVQGSFEELTEMLGQALRAAYPGGYPYIRATYPDSVVYDLDGEGPGAQSGTFRVSYMIDPADGDVEFGIPEQVQLKDVVIPLAPDTDNDRLGASLDALELDALEMESASIG